jgi:hypothetical protein
MVLLFSACATHITVSPKGCKTESYWELEGEVPDFAISKKVWFFGLPKEQSYFLKEILEDKNIPCGKLKSVSVSFESTWEDGFVSLFPFVARKGILISGTFLNNEDNSEVKESDL